ncbi:MAG: polysaccharide lyase family 7 protein [Pseudomonadota bacterium]
MSGLFDLEGNTPFPSPYAGTLNFSALTSKFATPNGHGYRNELKIAEKNRRTIELTREHFSALVTPTLPNGAKTIIAQYHVDGLDTILKVYVQDTADGQLLDGKPNNGIFDVVAKLRGTNGKDVATALGTVRSGESFALDIKFANGDAIVMVKTDKNGSIETERTRIKGDKRNIYFKFGDYLQALDPATLGLTTSPGKWDEYLLLHHIDNSLVSFSHTRFERD